MSGERFELKLLRELSARIGRDPLLVQASSGNTSIKQNGVLWIKASGKWLVNADNDDFFVPICLAEIRTCLQQNTNVSAKYKNSSGEVLCASIETAMHAVLPQKVVVHVHSVNTIAWAVQENGSGKLAECLAGLRWQWIPYAPSGVPLARKIEEGLSASPFTDVFVLGNHGLVVCGATCDATERLLAEVERRLRLEPRAAPEPNYSLLEEMMAEFGWCLPAFSGVHALATDRVSRQILSRGVLYPCQAIFLPGSTPALTPFVRSQEDDGCPSGKCAAREPFLLVEEKGVLAHKHMTRAEGEMLNGLAQIVRRIDARASIRYLMAGEIRSVLNKEADHYRRMAEADCARGRTEDSLGARHANA